MVLSTPQADCSQIHGGDELDAFPDRIIPPRHPKQDQRIRRIMSVKDDSLNPILTPSSLQRLKKYQMFKFTY